RQGHHHQGGRRHRPGRTRVSTAGKLNERSLGGSKMRRFSIGILFVVLAGGVAVPGCGKKGADDDDVAPPKRVSTGGPKTTVALDPFKGDSWDGIVRGRVVLKGN